MLRYPLIALSFFAILSGCQPESSVDGGPSLSPRQAFEAASEGFRLESSLVVRIDEDGAHVAAGADLVSLSLAGWGRKGAVAEVGPTFPELGACVRGSSAELDCIRQVERSHDGLSEWFTYGSEGLQQGWTLFQRPRSGSDSSPVVLDVSFAGADIVDVEQEKATLAGLERQWTYSGLYAWDATGNPLESWMEEHKGGVRILVRDLEATYPVTIDPTLSTSEFLISCHDAVGTFVSGDEPHFGLSLSDAGDVNGDGLSDLVVGAPDSGQAPSSRRTNEPDPGAAFIFYGDDGGTTPVGPGVQLPGASFPMGQLGSAYGTAVAGAGDLNDDEFDDVAVGAPSGASELGTVLLFYGSPTGLGVPTTSDLLESSEIGEGFGQALAGPGSLDGDQYEDLVVGAPRGIVGQERGRVYVYPGGPSGLGTPTIIQPSGGTSGDRFGQVIAAAGDVNDDGTPDVIIGAPKGEDGLGNQTGAAYIAYGGGPTGLSAAALVKILAPAGSSGAAFGTAVGPVGDVNGDGIDDVGVGAALAAPGGNTDQGLAYIFLGSPTGLNPVGIQVEPAVPGSFQRFGQSIGRAGDINGDGVDDAAIGAPWTTGQAGQLHFLYGSTSGLSSSTDGTLIASDQDGKDEFSRAVALLNDADGDARPDLAVGAPYWNDSGPDSVGAVYLYSLCIDEDLDGLCAPKDCDDNDPTPGAGDLDGDGICDDDDDDIDGDSVPNADDTDPLDPSICQDLDGDGCDDCGVTGGPPDTANDGPDLDGDGICDDGDDDIDGDSVLNGDDTDPFDPSICQDLDEDACDDCSVTRGPPDVENDGLDSDGDGICDATDQVLGRLQGGGCSLGAPSNEASRRSGLWLSLILLSGRALRRRRL